MKRLEIENLSFHYGQGGFQNQVLKNINFSMGDESVGLIGANGVGKSTLLKLLTGLLDIQEGSVRIASLEMNKGNLKKIRGEIGYVFQDSDSQLFMSTVYEDVAFAPRNYGKSEEETKRLVQKALEQVHMEGKSKRQIYRLSGGEKKLASIATVLAMEAGIMLLDEPSVALDPRNRRNLIQVLNELPKAKIIASHDLDFVYDTCQRAVLLSDGEIAADGETEKVLTNQKLLEAHGLELPLSFWRRN
ncbi:ATP-binding cassette domain-containing protein [Lachnospiraceae bacterium WCA-9-b2]|jgi:ABC-type cobalt transport system, ATPase component|uniref:ATP-binding cassette domain-containing protein n=1 Tax=Sporofaciens musculi TaxID=2681861 RepID=A0A7X3MLB0_9FIRM|nr:ABC transporter ATP-binding protein [Sporofaciens musculi]MXP78450.1 ATP-binding cassette domain-containing protein [Sporofaciens musculi]